MNIWKLGIVENIHQMDFWLEGVGGGVVVSQRRKSSVYTFLYWSPNVCVCYIWLLKKAPNKWSCLIMLPMILPLDWLSRLLSVPPSFSLSFFSLAAASSFCLSSFSSMYLCLSAYLSICVCLRVCVCVCVCVLCWWLILMTMQRLIVVWMVIQMIESDPTTVSLLLLLLLLFL